MMLRCGAINSPDVTNDRSSDVVQWPRPIILNCDVLLKLRHYVIGILLGRQQA